MKYSISENINQLVLIIEGYVKSIMENGIRSNFILVQNFWKPGIVFIIIHIFHELSEAPYLISVKLISLIRKKER